MKEVAKTYTVTLPSKQDNGPFFQLYSTASTLSPFVTQSHLLSQISLCLSQPKGNTQMYCELIHAQCNQHCRFDAQGKMYFGTYKSRSLRTEVVNKK